jgi:hypothetical protein
MGGRGVKIGLKYYGAHVPQPVLEAAKKMAQNENK